MQLILIRHSITAGNLEKRYLGRRTDEPLCPKGVALAQKNTALFQAYQPDILFCSPMKRCTETAEILFSKMQPQLVEDLAECDFGAFEGKNYQELSGVPAYQAWIDSGGTLPFPEGESQASFTAHCCAAVQRIVLQNAFQTAAIVAHGGTCMAILSQMEQQHIPYFDWHIPFCEPICCEIVSLSPLQLKLCNEKSG